MRKPSTQTKPRPRTRDGDAKVQERKSQERINQLRGDNSNAQTTDEGSESRLTKLTNSLSDPEISATSLSGDLKTLNDATTNAAFEERFDTWLGNSAFNTILDHLITAVRTSKEDRTPSQIVLVRIAHRILYLALNQSPIPMPASSTRSSLHVSTPRSPPTSTPLPLPNSSTTPSLPPIRKKSTQFTDHIYNAIQTLLTNEFFVNRVAATLMTSPSLSPSIASIKTLKEEVGEKKDRSGLANLAGRMNKVELSARLFIVYLA